MVVLMADASPARASADELVVRDSHIRSVYALDDTLVYRRFERRGKQRKWMWRRLVRGRVLPARGVPPGSRVGTIGRDRAGRVVLTMPVVERRKGGRLGYKWWIYDVARDRSRRLHGLRHGGCEPHSVSVWRNRLAYAASCKRRSNGGVFLREGDHTRRVANQDGDPRWLILRGGTLVALRNWVDDAVVWRLVEDGKLCRTRITDSYLPLQDFGYAGMWLAGDTLMWWTMHKWDTRPGTLVGTRLGNCGQPGPTGTFSLTSEPLRFAARAIDGRWLYYTDKDGIRQQQLPARPETDPPLNDDFERAEALVGEPPIVRRTTIGNATLQPGEPPVPGSTGTIWYAFRPITTQRLAIGASWPYGVFEGSDLRSLTLVGNPDPLEGHSFEGVAGRTYFIALGCAGYSCYVESGLRLTPFGSLPVITLSRAAPS